MRSAPSKTAALGLALILLAACEFAPPRPASTATSVPSPTQTPAPTSTATQPPTETLTPSPTLPINTETASATPAPVPLCLPPSTPVATGWAICQSQHYGFEVGYPQESVLRDVSESHARVDLPFTAGTNLVEKYLEITTSEGSQQCTSPQTQGFEPAAVPTQQVRVQSLGFTRQEGREGAAGNHYQWVAYSITRANVCVSLSFVLHSANPENFATPPPEFDPMKEAEIFDQIILTFRWE